MDITREFWASAREVSVGPSAHCKRALGQIVPDQVRRRHPHGAGDQPSKQDQFGTLSGLRNAAVIPQSDEFLVDAWAIASDVAALGNYVHHARRAYLGLMPTNVANGGTTSTSAIHVMRFDLPVPSANLTPAEREAMDVQCRMMLTNCHQRIKKLEAKLASERTFVAQDRIAGHTWTSLVAPHLSEEDILHQEHVLTHYTSVVWLLNERLFQLSMTQRRLQEKRLDQDLDMIGMDRPATRSPMLVSPERSTVGNVQKRPPPPQATDLDLATMNDQGSECRPRSPSPTIDRQLMQELEAECQYLLEQHTCKLEEIKKAEASLVSIAQMQTELSQHLAAQHSTIEALYHGSAVHTDNVREGNAQLVRAREANKASRFWFLLIVLVLSFSLLFLDWYAGGGSGGSGRGPVLSVPPMTTSEPITSLVKPVQTQVPPQVRDQEQTPAQGQPRLQQSAPPSTRTQGLPEHEPHAEL